MPSQTKPPMTCAEIPDEWIATVREIITREGVAVRGHATEPVIELKRNHRDWARLMLHGSGFEFVTMGERDLVVERLMR